MEKGKKKGVWFELMVVGVGNEGKRKSIYSLWDE